jgi:hypothetical protein
MIATVSRRITLSNIVVMTCWENRIAAPQQANAFAETFRISRSSIAIVASH